MEYHLILLIISVCFIVYLLYNEKKENMSTSNSGNYTFQDLSTAIELIKNYFQSTKWKIFSVGSVERSDNKLRINFYSYDTTKLYVQNFTALVDLSGKKIESINKIVNITEFDIQEGSTKNNWYSKFSYLTQ